MLTQEEKRGAVVLGVADDVLEGGGQRAIHHCEGTEGSGRPPASPPRCPRPLPAVPVPSRGGSPCRMPSEKAGSWMAFLRKFSMDLSRAARCGMHWTPRGGDFGVGLALLGCSGAADVPVLPPSPTAARGQGHGGAGAGHGGLGGGGAGAAALHGHVCHWGGWRGEIRVGGGFLGCVPPPSPFSCPLFSHPPCPSPSPRPRGARRQPGAALWA